VGWSGRGGSTNAAYPTPSTPYVRAIMRANRSRDTGPELRLRHVLHSAGLRYRVNYTIRTDGKRPITVDVAFTRVHLAVFVDGCFWHSCPEHGTTPAANATYWSPKLARNVERDREASATLELAGWTVARFWEHDEPTRAARRIVDLIGHLSCDVRVGISTQSGN